MYARPKAQPVVPTPVTETVKDEVVETERDVVIHGHPDPKHNYVHVARGRLRGDGSGKAPRPQLKGSLYGYQTPGFTAPPHFASSQLPHEPVVDLTIASLLKRKAECAFKNEELVEDENEEHHHRFVKGDGIFSPFTVLITKTKFERAQLKRHASMENVSMTIPVVVVSTPDDASLQRKSVFRSPLRIESKWYDEPFHFRNVPSDGSTTTSTTTLLLENGDKKASLTSPRLETVGTMNEVMGMEMGNVSMKCLDDVFDDDDEDDDDEEFDADIRKTERHHDLLEYFVSPDFITDFAQENDAWLREMSHSVETMLHEERRDTQRLMTMND